MGRPAWPMRRCTGALAVPSAAKPMQLRWKTGQVREYECTCPYQVASTCGHIRPVQKLHMNSMPGSRKTKSPDISGLSGQGFSTYSEQAPIPVAWTACMLAILERRWLLFAADFSLGCKAEEDDSALP